MSKRSRKKLSDIMRGGNSLLGTKSYTFQEAYPKIAKLYVEVIEGTIDAPDSLDKRIATESSFRQFFDCTNRLCYGGGVDITSTISDMVQKRETDREVKSICQGYEGSPKGRKRYRMCVHTFRIRVRIEYKNE